MDEQKTEKRNAVYLDNLAVLCALLEVGGAVMQEVEGSDEIASQVNGEAQTRRDYQEFIASRAAKAFGA